MGGEHHIRKSLNLYIVFLRYTLKDIKIPLNKICYTYTALMPRNMMFSLLNKCTIRFKFVTSHTCSLFCICHTCSLSRMELVVQFPARGSTQVLLCLFPGLLWLLHFLYSVGSHPVSSLHIYTFIVSRAFMVGAASQERDADAGHLVSPLNSRGPRMSTMVLYCWCHSDRASVLLYFTFFMPLRGTM